MVKKDISRVRPTLREAFHQIWVVPMLESLFSLIMRSEEGTMPKGKGYDVPKKKRPKNSGSKSKKVKVPKK